VTPSGQITGDARSSVMRELKGAFRPEFLNRVDDIVLFKPLQKSEILRIVSLVLDELRERLAGRRITISLDPQAAEYIAEHAYDPVYGARPLKRFVQHEIETRVGRLIIAGEVNDGDSLRVGVSEDGLEVIRA